VAPADVQPRPLRNPPQRARWCGGAGETRNTAASARSRAKRPLRWGKAKRKHVGPKQLRIIMWAARPEKKPENVFGEAEKILDGAPPILPEVVDDPSADQRFQTPFGAGAQDFDDAVATLLRLRSKSLKSLRDTRHSVDDLRAVAELLSQVAASF
jgi:hypothetical protein